MPDRFSPGQKPFTPIAVFSSIVEASGLLLLPSFSREVQDTFQWFLILFPILVVLLFFATINFNPQALRLVSDRIPAEDGKKSPETLKLLPTTNPDEVLPTSFEDRSKQVDELLESKRQDLPPDPVPGVTEAHLRS